MEPLLPRVSRATRATTLMHTYISVASPPVSVCLSVSRRRRDSKHKDAGATHFTPPSLFAFLHDFAYLAPSSQPNPTQPHPSTQPTLLTRPIDYHRKLTTPRCTLSPSLGPIRSLDLPGIISLSPPRPLIPNSFGSAPFLIRCAALPFTPDTTTHCRFCHSFSVTTTRNPALSVLRVNSQIGWLEALWNEAENNNNKTPPTLAKNLPSSRIPSLYTWHTLHTHDDSTF
jgi:hypothetical protein